MRSAGNHAQLEKYGSDGCPRRQRKIRQRTGWAGRGKWNVGWVTDGEGDGNGDITHIDEDEDGETVGRGEDGGEDGGSESGDGEYGGVDWPRG